jgi:hypothetical protein
MIPQNYVDLARQLGAWAIWGCVPDNPTIDLSGNGRTLTVTGAVQNSHRFERTGIPRFLLPSGAYLSHAANPGGTTHSMMVWVRNAGQGGEWISTGNSSYSSTIGGSTGSTDFNAGDWFSYLNTNIAWHNGLFTMLRGDLCIGVTVNGTAARIILNGVAVSTVTRASGTGIGAVAAMGRGSTGTSLGGLFGGGLIFPTALSDEAMRSLYLAGLGGDVLHAMAV